MAEKAEISTESPATTGRKKKLRTGLLLNSYKVPAWFYTSLQKIVAQDCAAIVLVVISGKSALKNPKSR